MLWSFQHFLFFQIHFLLLYLMLIFLFGSLVAKSLPFSGSRMQTALQFTISYIWVFKQQLSAQILDHLKNETHVDFETKPQEQMQMTVVFKSASVVHWIVYSVHPWLSLKNKLSSLRTSFSLFSTYSTTVKLLIFCKIISSNIKNF